MPYIERRRRNDVLRNLDAKTSGELNYLLTECIIKYIKNSGGLKYQIINDIIGALKGCSDEFYRRVVVPYEDKKIKENGDVYDNL